MIVYKRIIALLLAVIIPATLIFTGCGLKKEPTPREYYDGLYEAYKEYYTAIKELEPLFVTAKDLDSVKSVSAGAKDICGRADKALSKFEELNPPSKYADKHEKMIASLAEERRFLKASEKLFTAETLDAVMSAKSELEAYLGVYNNLPEDQLLPGILSELIKELKAEVG